MTKRDDIHRRAVIRPEDYEYVGLVFAPGGEEMRGYEHAEKLQQSAAAELRAYESPNRCDHCGAHIKTITVWRHVPTGGHIAAGITCVKETLQIPDRMTLDIKRLADWRAGVERPRTPEEWREQHLKEASHTYPETLATLQSILAKEMGEGEEYAWWKSATAHDKAFLLDVAGSHHASGRVSSRVDAVVKRIRAAAIERGSKLAAGMQPAPIGRGLTIEGVVWDEEITYNAWGSERHVMIVRGNLLWKIEATVPKGFRVKEGQRIRFVADVKSSRDPYFAFAKRPKKAEILPDEPPSAQTPPEPTPEGGEEARVPARSGHPEGSTDELREKARRLGIDFDDLLRAERRGRG